MQVPSVNTSARRLLTSFGVYHLARLEADPETRDRAGPFNGAQLRLDEHVDRWAAAHKATLTALAARRAARSALGAEVRVFAVAVRNRASNRRTSDLWRNCFPGGVRKAAGPQVDSGLDEVGIILAKLSEEADPVLTAHKPALEAAVAQLQAATESWQSARAAEQQASGTVQAEKLSWRLAYLNSHHDLQQLFYRDRKRADGYFKPVKNRPAARESSGAENGGDSTTSAVATNGVENGLGIPSAPTAPAPPTPDSPHENVSEAA